MLVIWSWSWRIQLLQALQAYEDDGLRGVNITVLILGQILKRAKGRVDQTLRYLTILTEWGKESFFSTLIYIKGGFRDSLLNAKAFPNPHMFSAHLRSVKLKKCGSPASVGIDQFKVSNLQITPHGLNVPANLATLKRSPRGMGYKRSQIFLPLASGSGIDYVDSQTLHQLYASRLESEEWLWVEIRVCPPLKEAELKCPFFSFNL